MAVDSIEGLMVTPLKIIPVDKGDVLHGIKVSESSFVGFGEAYFSTIHFGHTKGWKKHTQMTMNIVVPAGSIQFVVYDDRSTSASYGQYFDITIGKDNYCRLTVPKGVWMAFKGIGEETNLLMNFASMEHVPEEAQNRPLDAIPYDWSSYE